MHANELILGFGCLPNNKKTRMHASRMRTGRSLNRMLKSDFLWGGLLLLGGVPATDGSGLDGV